MFYLTTGSIYIYSSTFLEINIQFNINNVTIVFYVKYNILKCKQILKYLSSVSELL